MKNSFRLVLALLSLTVTSFLLAETPASKSLGDSTRAFQALAAAQESRPEAYQKLVEERAALMKSAAVADPAAVVRGMMSRKMKRALPAAVAAQMEAVLSGVGDYRVLIKDPAVRGEASTFERYIVLNGKTYPVTVYGRRLSSPTKLGIPLRAVIVGQTAILDESAIAEVSSEEIQGESVTTVPAAAGSRSVYSEMGGKYFRFASREALLAKEQAIRAEEAVPGPTNTPVSRALLALTTQPQATALPEISTSATPPNWTTEVHKVLVIRVDFSDLAQDPYNSVADIQTVMDSQIASFFSDDSYSKTSLQTAVSTSVYRMSKTASAYAVAGDSAAMMTEAKTLAGKNYTIGSYQNVILVFPSLGGISGSQITYGGLGDVGAGDAWINGRFIFEIVSHELGHNYGLSHAGAWSVSDGNPISASGVAFEYGDVFDAMGSDPLYPQNDDFNIFSRQYLGWIGPGQTQTVTQTTTVRLYNSGRDNTPNNSSELLGVRVLKDATRYYWISYRWNEPAIANGAYVIWAFNQAVSSTAGNYQTLLLNMNPDAGFDDSLAVGNLFQDPATSLTVQTMDEGGSGSNRYIDVALTIGGGLPTITTQPADILVTSGMAANFTLVANATSYKWQTSTDGNTWQDLVNNTLFSNVATAVLSVNTNLSLDGSEYRCAASNATGTIYSNAATLRVSDPGPHISTQPISTALFANSALTFTVNADGAGDTYQWRKNGVNIPGATSPELTIATATSTDNGMYDVLVSNPAGTTTSAAASATVFPVVSAGGGGTVTTGTAKLVNISTRALVQGGENVAIAGFIIGGTTPKTVLIRASGPALAPFGLNFLSDPQLHVYASATNVDFADNDDWDTDPNNQTFVTTATAQVGAKGFAAGSKDAALVLTLNPGGYTAIVSGPAGSSGITLVEVFEFDVGNTLSRLANISTRSPVGTNANVQIAGFVISGSVAKKVIIRANGPALAKFSIANFLTDPYIELHDSNAKIIATNDNWDASTMKTEFQMAGIDNWDTGSKDAAIITTLQPGIYTAIVSGVGGTSGVSLVEVFEAP